MKPSDLLARAAVILAGDDDEQLELPNVPQERDMKRYVRKSKYDALLDRPTTPEEHAAYDELEKQYEEHIESVVDFLESHVPDPRDWDNHYPDFDYTVNTTTLIRWIENAASRYGSPRVRNRIVAALRANAFDTQILRDIIADNTSTDEYEGQWVVDSYLDEGTDDLAESISPELEELTDGLDEDDLDRVAEDFERNNSDGVTIGFRVRGPNLSLTYYVPYSNHYYANLDLETLIDELNNLLENEERLEQEQAADDEPDNFLSEQVVKDLPPGLTANQLALLRLFDVQKVDQIKSADLKGLPIANVPWVNKLLKQHKVLTPDIVLKAEHPELKSDALKRLQTAMTMQTSTFPLRVQLLWRDRQNWEFIFGLPNEKFTEVFGFDMPQDVTRYMHECRSKHMHPAINTETLTIGWFRFTVFEKDIWIDEVQTDLESVKERKLGEASVALFQKALGSELGQFLFENFVREMRARGYQRFFLPTYETKKDVYPGSTPPAALYNDVPKAMRFRAMDFIDLDRPEFKQETRIDDHKKIFVLASTRVEILTAMADRLEELQLGTEEEMEHTDDPEEARRIAEDHLEHEPEYYTKLGRCGLA